MSRRTMIGVWLLAGLITARAEAVQTGIPQVTPPPQNSAGANWSSRGTPAATASGQDAAPRAHVARVTSGTDVLPRSAGQVWRNYDISPFTQQFDPRYKPEQEIIDWVLRETGTDLWFLEPLGILSATHDSLRVYHTPEVQAVIHDIVDRFVDPNARSHVLTFHLVTVGSPNWRTKAFPVLQPVQVQSDGIQAWLVSKENAAILLGDLRRRSDFQELQGPSMFISSGRTEVLSRTKPINYVSGVAQNPQNPAITTPTTESISEGFSLEVSALKSLDGSAMDAVVKCSVNQVEKFQNVSIDLFNPYGQQPTRTQIQVPQMVNWRLHERFKWPTNQVLLLSCGVVATPGPAPGGLLPIPGMFDGSRGRADALLFLEVKRANEVALLQNGAGQPGGLQVPNVNTQGRY